MHCGKSAKLVIECHQGQAHVNLHHALTILPEELHNHHQEYGHHHPRQGTSRQRRRARRALARAAAAKAAKSGAKADKTTQTSDVAAETTVDKPTYHHQEHADQAVQACPPPHHDQAVQACPLHHHDQAVQACPPHHHDQAVQANPPPPTHISADQTTQTSPLDDSRAAHLEPVRDVFCVDREYSAGQAAPLRQAIPQVDGLIDLSPSTIPSFPWDTATGILQYLDGRPGRNRDREEEERKKEREKELEFVKTLVQKI